MFIAKRLARSINARYLLGGALGSAVCMKFATTFITRGTTFRDFSTLDDNLFNHQVYRASNPHHNPTLHDLCVRKVPLAAIRADLVEDARQGGTQLVQEFCRGMWSGRVFGAQRTLMRLFAERGRLERELWTKNEIRRGVIDIGTRIGGEFEVISIEPSSIVLRGGQPKTSVALMNDEVKEGVDIRDVDVFAELTVRIDLEDETAEFQFKGIFFCGTGQRSPPPLPAALDPLHRFYASALLREGSQACLR